MALRDTVELRTISHRVSRPGGAANSPKQPPRSSARRSQTRVARRSSRVGPYAERWASSTRRRPSSRCSGCETSFVEAAPVRAQCGLHFACAPIHSRSTRSLRVRAYRKHSTARGPHDSAPANGPPSSSRIPNRLSYAPPRDVCRGHPRWGACPREALMWAGQPWRSQRGADEIPSPYNTNRVSVINFWFDTVQGSVTSFPSRRARGFRTTRVGRPSPGAHRCFPIGPRCRRRLWRERVRRFARGRVRASCREPSSPPG